MLKQTLYLKITGLHKQKRGIPSHRFVVMWLLLVCISCDLPELYEDGVWMKTETSCRFVLRSPVIGLNCPI